MPTRKTFTTGLAVAATALLSSCGTVLYPARVHQKERGELDPSIVILDGIGLFFFIIPGLLAFVVDFATGAIYYPAGKDPADPERTILDEWKEETSKIGGIDRQTIERFLSEQSGRSVRLDEETVLVQELDHLDHFDMAYRNLTLRHLLAQN